ncbi:DJ-1/PfpI family protein [Aurantiacibacter aquimixticola]|uniref:DJ-1/PfpI family protein n=1 Tax=Aurantiacibacter aquimixticola TaxID=1958945 RepID=A0A419RNF7_9SPHN|nr:DJ-1/PfpI family protein [Aurantiacibacter aquimixticola]RJY06928.1 DJ-1/PfpI family protein [Aurantiacibacter aquimixticola]
MTLDRRQILALAALAGGAGAFETASAEAHDAQGRMPPLPEDAPKIAMLVHPRMIALDLINPMTVFNILRSNIMLVGKTMEPAATDVRIPIGATHTFDQVPREVDVLFVPGGIMGTIAAMDDPETLTFLSDCGRRAKWVTSVCTGSLLLGAAGLLQGYRAASHWTVSDLLPKLGATKVDERVVIDRNRMTGGGATAGLDFGLTLAAKLVDEEAARRIQLILEYAPEPPFANGTPAQAGPERVATMRAGRPWMDAQALKAVEAAAERLGLPA